MVFRSISLFVAGSALALPLLVGSAAAQDKTQNQGGPSHQLMLMGGDLKICSSMSSMNCNDIEWIDRENMRMDRYMNLSSKYRSAALDKSLWPVLRRDTLEEVAEGIELVHQRVKQDIMPERVFQEEFTRRATSNLYQNLSDNEWNRILDHLEMPTRTGSRDTVELEENVNRTSASLIQKFVGLAGSVRRTKDLPKILVVTAAERDPLDKVDFYKSLFTDAGARVEWLPIDAAVAAAQRNESCDELDKLRERHLGAWQRARVHAEHHKTQMEFCEKADAGLAMLESADAVYFGNGDANLLRNALVQPNNQPTDLLREIYERMNDNTLVVGAHGASVAALTGKPMLSNGTSRSALKDGAKASEPPGGGCDRDNSCPPNLHQDSLTYHPMGGLGLFPYATLDTHFSERGRHGRLMRLAATTSTPMAVGIDEMTALLVDVRDDSFQIFGERGVFFAVGTQQTERAVAGSFHYLLDGTSGKINELDITDVKMSEDISLIKVEPSSRFMANRGAMDALRLLCRERKQMNLVEDEFSMTMQVDEDSTTQRTGGECQVLNGRMGVIWDPQEQL